MCGRFELIDGKRVFVRYPVSNTMPSILDNTDVRPTQQILVLQADHVLSLMRWGLVPPWATDPRIGSKMINARAESVAEKPSFKRPLRFQRCIIPASAFFEWKSTTPGIKGAKVKLRIARKDGDLLSFAGLYDTWRTPSGDELATCTIITTTPNSVVAPIHNRMPVILRPEYEEAWINPDLTEPVALVHMLQSYPAELLVAEPVLAA